MVKLLGIAIGSILLALGVRESDLDNQKIRVDMQWNIYIMLIPMILMCGLRTDYNDTGTYIKLFEDAGTLKEFLTVKENLNLLSNPAYYALQTIFKQFVCNNYHLFFMVIAIVTLTSFIFFIRKYSSNMAFSLVLFFTIGLYMFCFAALKQCIAMSILFFAIPQLLKRKYARFYILVFVAILFHAYAIMFVILPIFTFEPWTKQTYLTIIVILVILFTFESTITSMLDYAESLGKVISEEEVFNTESINMLRLAVYAVPPIFAFVFQRYLKPYYNRTTNLLINMSIFSFLILLLGLASAGNLFARCAIYFEIGTICVFPWMIGKIFNKKSQTAIYIIATICYLIFFWFDNADFDVIYRAISLQQFFGSLVGIF